MTKALAQTQNALDPWSDLDRLFGEMTERFFDPFGFGAAAPASGSDGAWLRPARTDVSDTGASYKIVAEVPGIPKEKLDISVRGSTVEIRGEQSQEKSADTSSYVHRERSYQGYYRLLELPEPVVAADAKAKVEHGLLELELPKQTPTPSPAEVKVRVA